MRRIFSFSGAMASVCVVVVLIAWSARADDSVKLNRLLKGDYAFTSTRACSSVIYNFFPSGTPNVPDNGNAFTAFPDLNLRGSSTSNTFIDRAIMRYDGKGNVTLVDGRTFLIVDQVTGVGQSQVRSNVFTCTGVYQVNPDRSFTQQISCAIQRIAGVFVGEGLHPGHGVSDGGADRTGRANACVKRYVHRYRGPDVRCPWSVPADLWAQRFCGQDHKGRCCRIA